MMKITTLNEYVRQVNINIDLTEENKELRQRIDTAIDYINKLEFEEYGVLYDNGTSIMEYEDNCKETLLEILKGSDK